MKKAALLLILAACSTSASAKDYWVSDKLTITLRTGESTQHQIIKTVASGTKLNITETNEESGYSYAILEDGTEGWVLTRFLVDSPVAQQKLKAAQQELKKLKAENRELKRNLKQEAGDQRSLEKSHSKLKKEVDALTKELKHVRNISSNSLSIAEENQSLNAKVIQLGAEIQSLEQENLILRDRSDRDWFIAGTGVTLLGLLIGLIAPRIRMRKKANWNEL